MTADTVPDVPESHADAWTITTGTDSPDKHLVDTVYGVGATVITFLAIARYLAVTGIQDAWMDGDEATIHASGDRWLILRAGDEVTDDEMEAVMNDIRPFIEAHDAN